jgi:histidine triad (HIT) family protein
MDCVFCKIITGELPGNILYRDEDVIAFRDIQPMTPTHVLVLPTKHIGSLPELMGANPSLISRMATVANDIAKNEGIAERGYRLVVNSGREGGQLVPHLHMHLLGGRHLSGRIG